MKKRELTVVLALVSMPLSGSLCGEEEEAQLVAPDAGDAGVVNDAELGIDAVSIARDASEEDVGDVGSSTTSDAAIASDASDAEVVTSDASAMDAAMPRVFFVSPIDGEIIGAQTVFWFDVEGFTLSPAFRPSGPGEGHLHLFVNRPCARPGDVIERVPEAVFDLDEGQKSAFVVLPIGIHALCLQAGTSAHVALSMTDAIVVQVR
jgi:hypothetical protein